MKAYWKTIDSAPKDGTKILTANGNNISVRHWGENEDGDMVWLPRIRGAFPTHWDYLPEGPEC